MPTTSHQVQEHDRPADDARRRLLAGLPVTERSLQLAGVPTTWDMTVSEVLYILAGNGLGLLMGFTLGVLFRNSAAAIVGYFVYSMVLPTLSALLAGAQDWYADAQPWVDFQWNQTGLFDGGYGPTEWAQLLVTGTIWLLLPLAFGLWRVLRSEVK